MNKAFCRIRNISSLFFTGCLILFNLSCGLDTFYVIDGPTNVIEPPSYDKYDRSSHYFDFYTVDKDYDDNIKFLGTEVYYKIYKSSSRLRSEVSDINTIATRSDSASAAAERMIQSYKYQVLRAAGHEDQVVLIPTVGYNQRVNIRLSTYTVFPAQISIDGSESIGIPVRNLPNSPGFNFSNSIPDSIPKSEDVDVNTSGSSSSTDWYISLFAVAVGQDYTYSPIYSNVLYLGSVYIPVE